MDLRGLADEREILKPFGELDVLLLYALASSVLEDFLGDREVASKVWLKQRTLLNRGSQLPPLHAEEIARNVTPDLLKLRAQMGLPEARGNLNPVEEKVWRYFPPRKLCDYFYASSAREPRMRTTEKHASTRPEYLSGVGHHRIRGQRWRP